MRAVAEVLLERYGIVTRETVLAEGIPGGFAALYGELTNLETLGTARRGYFVEGLGGAQFALPAAIERLRSLKGEEGLRAGERAGALVLAATDPANPFGATLPWPKREDGGRAAAEPRAGRLRGDPRRRAGALCGAWRQGARCRLGEERPLTLTALEALADEVRRGRVPPLKLERFDGEPVVGSVHESMLVEIGFRQGPRRLTLSA